MKKTTIVIADRNAINYFCLLKPVQAKKVLFAMSLLKGDQRLGDSSVAEARHIAEFYDGVISAEFAKDLATLLSNEYSKRYPGILITKKKVEAYNDARYRKLLEALGLYGFDYVVTALAQGKLYVNEPANGIDETRMLQALRWVERKEGVDKELSNTKHRRKGLYLVGLGDMVDALLPHTFTIANVYELVTPGIQNVTATVDEDEEGESELEELTPMTVLDMKIHFIENAGLLLDFYGSKKPEIPEGFLEEELREGSATYALAMKDMLKDSEAVLKYVRQKNMFESCAERLGEIFSDDEIKAIHQNEAAIKELIKNAW